MSDFHTGTHRKIWLHLLREGGFHSVRELQSAVQNVYTPNWHATMREMTRTGAVAKREGKAGALEYGVTLGCHLPREMTVGDVADALMNQEA